MTADKLAGMAKEVQLFGPFGYVRSPRLCPDCRSRLVVMGGWGLNIGQGLLGRMGVVCHCVRCNTKYRAQETISLKGLRLRFIAIYSIATLIFIGFLQLAVHLPLAVLWGGFAMLLSLGFILSRRVAQWLWWANATLEHVTTFTQDSSFMERE